MLNSEDEKVENKEEAMPSYSKSAKRKGYDAARKRIHNPKTGRYYQIRQRSSSKGQRGTIMDTWSPPTKKGRKRK